jgi:hypothetical protein
MIGETNLPHAWSTGVGRELLSSIPNVTLAAHWGKDFSAAADGEGVGLTHLRHELLTWAEQDDEVRRWIVCAWRETHPAAAATEHALTEGSVANCVRLLEDFDARDVLLALVTDEFDNGWELAAALVEGVVGDGLRRALRTTLRRLAGDVGGEGRRLTRVVILGGHQRDESKFARRLFDGSPFEVRWRTFQKTRGPAVEKAIVSVLRCADAAILIMGMASHTLVHLVKDFARRRGMRWCCVTKATDKQLTAALNELFPQFAVERK